mmetsp:Transcript_135/g.113  ORF Transcript_135/g.113 Transcript_135/m.113 type:complete len:143 (-) Transcript_135:2285-2713(-)
MALILGVIVFWLLNLQFSPFKRPPALRFLHLARVTFVPPATGAFLASVPAIIVAILLTGFQKAQLFSTVTAMWTEFGGEPTDTQKIEFARGRLGMVLTVTSIVFLLHGAENIITQPTEEEEEEIIEKAKEQVEIEKVEMSIE